MASNRESLAEKTEQVRMTLANNLAGNRVFLTLVDAHRLLSRAFGESVPGDPGDLLDSFFAASTASRHMLV